MNVEASSMDKVKKYLKKTIPADDYHQRLLELCYLA